MKRYPGTVKLSDPLSFPQTFAFEDALKEIENIEEDKRKRIPYIILKGICPCVEEWNLEGLGQLTPDTFPATPRVASSDLVRWLIEEVSALYKEAEEIPLD